LYIALGQFVYKYRFLVIAFWLAIFAASFLFWPRVAGVLKGGGFVGEEAESVRGGQVAAQNLGIARATIVIVFSSDSYWADEAPFQAEMEQALTDVRNIPEVKEITTYASSGNPRMVSKDGHTTYANIGLKVDVDKAQQILPQLEKSIRPTSLRTWVTGEPVVFRDMEEVSKSDLEQAEKITFPFALLVLLVIFGSLVASGVPVVMGGISVTLSLALLYFLAQKWDMSIFSMNVVTMLGLAVGIDYSLFMISRFREELRKSSVEESVVTTVARAGRAVSFSGFTVCVGLAGLVYFPSMMLRSVGIGGLTVVLVSVLVSISFLPALLAILGAKINALSLPIRWSGEGTTRFWHNLALKVMKYPIPIIVVVLAVIFTLAWPVTHLKLGVPGAAILPADVASRQGYEVLDKNFGASEVSPIMVVVQSDKEILSPDNVGVLYDYTRTLASDKQVRRIDSIVTLDPRVTKETYQQWYSNPQNIPEQLKYFVDKLARDKTTVLLIIPESLPNSEEAHDLVQKIRGMNVGKGMSKLVAGYSAGELDFINELKTNFPMVIVLIVFVTYLVLFRLFGSLVLPAKAVFMNACSILASYGVVVFVFQDGNFSSLLNFTSWGGIESSIPVIMFCTLFGVSMDYEIFMLTRIKEAYDTSKDNTSAVATGLEQTGRIITGAALIVVVVAGSFTFTNIIITKALGVGLAVAILLDATLVRALLVPATMRLLGRWNWWPGK